MPKTMTPDPHNLDLMFFPFLSPPPPGVDPAAAALQVAVTEAGADEAPASFSLPDGFRLVRVETLRMLDAELRRLKQIERELTFAPPLFLQRVR